MTKAPKRKKPSKQTPSPLATGKRKPPPDAPKRVRKLRESCLIVVVAALALAVGSWWSYFNVVLANPLVATGSWTAATDQNEMGLTGFVVQSVPNGLGFQLEGPEGSQELVFRKSGTREYRHEGDQVVYIAVLAQFNRMHLERRLLGGRGIERAVFVRSVAP